MTGPKILWVIPIFGGVTITQTTLTSWIVMAILILAAFLLTRNLSVEKPGRVQIILEKLVTMLYDMVENTMGSHNLFLAPYIGTLLVTALFGSLIGMTGVLRSSTADLSTTASWALATMALVWYFNIKNNGFFGWLKSFTEPIAVMTPINIISEIASPVSMAFRFFGNMAGGVVMTSLIYSGLATVSLFLLQWIPNAFLSTIPILQVGIPAILSIYFDVFTSGVQSLIFCMLTMIYIGNANPSKQGN